MSHEFFPQFLFLFVYNSLVFLLGKLSGGEPTISALPILPCFKRLNEHCLHCDNVVIRI